MEILSYDSRRNGCLDSSKLVLYHNSRQVNWVGFCQRFSRIDGDPMKDDSQRLGISLDWMVACSFLLLSAFQPIPAKGESFQETVKGARQNELYQSRTYRDGGEKDWHVSFRERIVQPDGTILFRTRGVYANGDPSFSETRYSAEGEPLYTLQRGSWGQLESTLHPDKITRIVEGAEQSETIERNTLKDPTKLWFWKTQPVVDETITVKNAQNNVPGVSEIRYTYLGREDIKAAGKTVNAHKVREVPLGVNPGVDVYTLRWFDDQGMEVHRYHKVQKNVYETTLLEWQ
jgi:hypothetical protein